MTKKNSIKKLAILLVSIQGIYTKNLFRLDCALIRCTSDTTCINGICVPNAAKCVSAEESPQKVYCTERPSREECPDLQYIRAPDLKFCGVDKNGEQQGFARSCQVCMNKHFKFYYESPCEDLPGLICKDYEFCTLEGTCLDKCATIRCQAGYQCSKGTCAKTVPIKERKEYPPRRREIFALKGKHNH